MPLLNSCQRPGDVVPRGASRAQPIAVRTQRLATKLLVLTACVPVFCAAAPAAKTPQSLYAQAHKLYGARKYEEALGAFRQVVASDPDPKSYMRANAELRLAACLRLLNRHEEALKQFGHVIATYADQALRWTVHVSRGELLSLMERYEDADADFRVTLTTPMVSPNTMGMACRGLVSIRQAKGEYKAALVEGTRMFQIGSMTLTSEAITKIAECYKQIDGDIDPNVRAFLEFQKLGPAGQDGKAGTPDDLSNPLDTVLIPQDKEREAALRQAIAETEPKAPIRRARLWLLRGDHHRALREYLNAYSAAALETTKRRWPRPLTDAANEIAVAMKAIDGHVHRANQYLLYQRYGPAGEDGKPDTDDDLTNPLQELAEDYWQKHAPPDPDLDAKFQAAIDEQEDTMRGRRARGYLYLAWGKPDQAMVEMKAAYRLCPLRQSDLLRAITDIAVAIKGVDGDIFRANRYLLYMKHGPKGKDGIAGNEDDLKNPLGEGK